MYCTTEVRICRGTVELIPNSSSGTDVYVQGYSVDEQLGIGNNVQILEYELEENTSSLMDSALILQRLVS